MASWQDPSSLQAWFTGAAAFAMAAATLIGSLGFLIEKIKSTWNRWRGITSHEDDRAAIKRIIEQEKALNNTEEQDVLDRYDRLALRFKVLVAGSLFASLVFLGLTWWLLPVAPADLVK